MPVEVLRKKIGHEHERCINCYFLVELSLVFLGSFGYKHVLLSQKIFKAKSNGNSRDFSVPGRHPIKLQVDRSTSPCNWLSNNIFFFFQWQNI